jgi:CSLREA domain-containing protein
MKYGKKLFVTCLVTICASLFLTVSTAQAVTFTVTKTADTDDGVCTAGDCSLREAIFAANDLAGPDTIEFAAGVFAPPKPVQQIILSVDLPHLFIDDDLTINGPGARQLLINGNDDDRIFLIGANRLVSIRNLAILNGHVKFGSIGQNPNPDCAGGGIKNHGDLTLNRVRLYLNQADCQGGGIFNYGTLTIVYSIISNNYSNQYGGGIYSQNGTVKIANSTVTDNEAQFGGGGIRSDADSELYLNNATISHNTAGNEGGGIASYTHQGLPINKWMRNTIVANNNAPSYHDLLGVFNSQGSNLIRVNSANVSFPVGSPNNKGDYVGTFVTPLDPKLGPLQDNGGLSNTRALLPGSPAIDKGDSCVTWTSCVDNKPPIPLVYDQRFTGFARNSGASVDIGAFEVDSIPTLSVSNVNLPEGDQNTTNFNFVITLSAGSAQTVSVNYQTAGINAVSGADFVNTSGTLSFAPGETSKQITVPVIGDLTAETDEQFNLNLSAPVNAALSDGQGVGTIKDDDNGGLFKFKFAPYSGTENSSVLVTVERAYGTVGTVSVHYETNGGSATASVDYTPVSGDLTFADGETTKTFTINLLDDQTYEQTENINLYLSNPTGKAKLGSPADTAVSIQDNDAPATASIGGVIAYGNTPANQAQKFVPKAMVTAIGASAVSVPTDSSGAYLLENLTTGSAYTVSLTKSGDRNGISPFDATLVLRHVAANGQGPNALSVNQQKAADTNGDGNISPFDATLILRYIAAGGQTPNTGQTGNWKFLPGTQNYQSLNNSLSGENYEAVLIGEVNGDWTPPAPGSFADTDNQGEIAASVEETEAEISLPDNESAASGSIIVVPVTFASKIGKSISGYNFDIAFDPNVLQPDSAMPIETSATLSREMTVVHNTAQPGRIGIAASGANSNERISKGDALLNLRFRVVGTTNDLKKTTTALTFHQQPIIENESGTALTVKSANGSVRISAGGAGKSVATVSGRITTADGRGIRNVSVRLACANGETRTVVSDTGGEYSFTDVPLGETYTISVSSKRFHFNSSSQMRTIFSEAQEINFTALE